MGKVGDCHKMLIKRYFTFKCILLCSFEQFNMPQTKFKSTVFLCCLSIDENAPSERESSFCTAFDHLLYSWRAVFNSVSGHRRLVRTPSRGCTRGFGHSKAVSAVSSLVIPMTSLWSVWVRRCVNIQREVALGFSYPLRWNAENVYDGASVTSARMRQGAEGDRSQYRSLEGWFEQ